MNQPIDGPSDGGARPESGPDGSRGRRQESRNRRPGQDPARPNRDGPAPHRANASDGNGLNPPSKRSGNPVASGEAREGRKRRRDGNDRRGRYGFGDAIERATCTSLAYEMPNVWPVQNRPGVATLRAVEVDRRPEAILYCDGAHIGPHFWPDGEIVAGHDPVRDTAGPD